MKVFKYAGALTIAGLLTVLAGASAGAQILGQPSQPVSNPLSLKVGAFFPGSGTDSHAAGSTQISAGADYALAKTTSTNPSIPSVYFDYSGGSRNGGHVNSYGLGVAIRSYANQPAAKSKGGSVYLGAGIGAYIESGKKATEGTTTFSSDNKVNIGGKVFVGDELPGGFFVEANYQIIPSVGGVNPSGLGVQVGMRF